jgi:hypothetical protein
MGNDRHRRVRGTMRQLRRRSGLRRPPINKLRVLADKFAIELDANVPHIAVVSGETSAFGFWAGGEKIKLIKFEKLPFLDEERQTQSRP